MKEEEIRKRDVFDKYLEMVKQDVASFFNDTSSFIRVPCPACESRTDDFQFHKGGFAYVLCNHCNTLYVNPRPPFEMLSNFYTQSPSTSFWVNEFFKPVAEARREKIFKPRAEFVADTFGSVENWTIGDVGAGFGLFLQELSRMWPSSTLVAIEPSEEMTAICRSKSLEVLPCALEDVEGWDGRFDLLTSFELFEHLYDPKVFLQKVLRLLRPGGSLLLTTLNGEGFDIQLLWEESKSVSPPHHLNFFNPDSIRILFENSGFTMVEVSTPGKLDWDIVEGMINNEGIDAGRFWNALAKKGTGESKKGLQGWIEKSNLSSHMRVLAKKAV